MTPRIPAANRVAALFAAVAIGAVGFAASPAVAQTTNPQQKPPKEAKRQFDNRGRAYYGPSGPNVSYQQGNTRIFVSKRSWLDAGTEVLPGDRKFTDYAFPPVMRIVPASRGRAIGTRLLNKQDRFGKSLHAVPDHALAVQRL
jgi:hypothetical protein